MMKQQIKHQLLATMEPIVPFHLAGETCLTKPVSSSTSSSSVSASCKDSMPCMPSRKRLESSFFEYEDEDEQEPQALNRKELILSTLSKVTDIIGKDGEIRPSLWNTSSSSNISLENFDNGKFHTGALEFPTSACHSDIAKNSLSEISIHSCQSEVSENSLSDIPSLESFSNHFLVDSMTSFASFCSADALEASVAGLQIEETRKEDATIAKALSRPSNMPKPCLKVSTASNPYGPQSLRETRWFNGDSSSDSLPSLKGRVTHH
jgi:hypothetical protein